MKYFGVIIDNKLVFDEKHINSKVRKVTAKIAIVFRNTFGNGNMARRIIAKGCLETLSTVWYTVLVRKGVVKAIRGTQ